MEDSVRKLFEEYGTVTDCFMPKDRETGRVRGFCFVTMPANEAENACNKTNGYELDGRPLRVNEAQPRGEGGGGRGGGGRGGYGGGGYGGGTLVASCRCLYFHNFFVFRNAIDFWICSHDDFVLIIIICFVTIAC